MRWQAGFRHHNKGLAGKGGADDLAGGPQRKTIAGVEPGQFGKPVVTFNDSTKLSLNKTNVRALGRVWGTESDGWIGQELELQTGTLEYNGQVSPAILVSPTPPAATTGKPPPRQGDLDDEIPF